MIPFHNMANDALLINKGRLVRARFCVRGIFNLCRGGVAIQDGTQGIDFQDWVIRISAPNTVSIEPRTSGVGTTLIIPGIRYVSGGFDRGMNLALAYETADGKSYFYWFDTVPNQYVTTEYPGISNILACHDDVRDTSSDTSDMILTYEKNGAIYWREQRDRYLIEYLATANPVGHLTRFGMASSLRCSWRTEPEPEPAEPVL